MGKRLAKHTDPIEDVIRDLEPYIAAVVRNHCGNESIVDDLVQEGFIAAYKAFGQYRTDTDMSFDTFVKKKIVWAIRTSIGKATWTTSVKTEQPVFNQKDSHRESIFAYKSQHPEASMRAIADALGINVSTVHHHLKRAHIDQDAEQITEVFVVSPVDEDGKRFDVVEERTTEDIVMDAESLEYVRNLINSLPGAQRLAALAKAEDRSFNEVAKSYSMTAGALRQAWPKAQKALLEQLT